MLPWVGVQRRGVRRAHQALRDGGLARLGVKRGGTVWCANDLGLRSGSSQHRLFTVVLTVALSLSGRITIIGHWGALIGVSAITQEKNGNPRLECRAKLRNR